MNNRKQNGASIFGWLLIICMVAFIGLIALKLVPIYLEHYFLTEALNTFKSDYKYNPGSSTGVQNAEIKAKLARYFAVNEISHATAENVLVTTEGGYLVVNIKYDVTVPMLFNIDAVVHFDDTVKISPNS